MSKREMPQMAKMRVHHQVEGRSRRVVVDLEGLKHYSTHAWGTVFADYQLLDHQLRWLDSLYKLRSSTRAISSVH
jgi:hypothetical protein